MSVGTNNPQYGKNKKVLLKVFIEQSEYISISDQPKICESFGFSFSESKYLFRHVYTQRCKDFLFTTTTTIATVEAKTGIPQKYLCQVKARLEKKRLLQVVGLGICPTTLSKNVQFVSTNPDEWSKPFNSNPKQLTLF